MVGMGYPQSMCPCAVLWGRVQPRRVRLGPGVAVGEVSSTNPEVGELGMQCSNIAALSSSSVYWER